MIVKLRDVRRVDLSDAAEQRLLEAARRCGGGVVFDQAALEQQMCNVVELLSQIDAALLPPILRDVVPRTGTA